MRKILFIFGTRPEAIKMVPLIKEFEKYNCFDINICVTGQHREMLHQVLSFFEVKPHFDLDLMQQGQTLFDITSIGLKKLESVLNECKADLIFVQGDTTTALIGALAAFYKQVKIAHLEAGLRSHNKYSPFPEEMNRILISHMADYQFVPTLNAKENLQKENIHLNIWIVGNSVIDALLLGLDIIQKKGDKEYYDFFHFLDFNKKIILVTGHRRESFGEPFEAICHALKIIVDGFEDVEILYPVHLNPNVREPVYRILNHHQRVHLIEPLPYPHLIWLMSKSYFVLTDSGGIQEEAPTLGKPVLVMREVTEREEGVQVGTAKLVGTNKEVIVAEVTRLLVDKDAYNKMSQAVNPYGDGTTAQKIANIVKNI